MVDSNEDRLTGRRQHGKPVAARSNSPQEGAMHVRLCFAVTLLLGVFGFLLSSLPAYTQREEEGALRR
jgi:hypothetical protein